MELIIHYKGSKMFDVISLEADHYNPVLKTNITERLIINDDITTQMWNNLSLEEIKMAKEMIKNNKYTDYVSWMKMNKRNEKVDKLLNENSIKNP